MEGELQLPILGDRASRFRVHRKSTASICAKALVLICAKVLNDEKGHPIRLVQVQQFQQEGSLLDLASVLLFDFCV
ncbi:MAG: hypothetical protein D6690_04985 [Nitrospirae bacterium]|nr:MAG: hypothetical protein D6690_04985 [Nitrospirota bacterium]